MDKKARLRKLWMAFKGTESMSIVNKRGESGGQSVGELLGSTVSSVVKLCFCFDYYSARDGKADIFAGVKNCR